MILARIIIGLLVAATGAAIIRYARNLYQWFGANELAERYLGGTLNGWRIAGLLMIFVGIFYTLGLINALLGAISGFLGNFF